MRGSQCFGRVGPAQLPPRQDRVSGWPIARQQARFTVSGHEDGGVFGLGVLSHGPACDDERVLVAANLLELRTDVEQFQMGHAITTSSGRQDGDQRRTVRRAVDRAQGPTQLSRVGSHHVRAVAPHRLRQTRRRRRVCDPGLGQGDRHGQHRHPTAALHPRFRARSACGQRRVRATNQQRRPLRRRRSAEHGQPWRQHGHEAARARGCGASAPPARAGRARQPDGARRKLPPGRCWCRSRERPRRVGSRNRHHTLRPSAQPVLREPGVQHDVTAVA